MTSCCKTSAIACMLVLSALAVGGCPAATRSLGWVYSLGSYEEGDSITRSSDGAYFVVGQGRPRGDTTSYPRVMATKLSVAGTTEWWQFVDGLYPQGGQGPNARGVAVADGGLVISGLTDSSLNQYTYNAQLRVVKYGTAGNLVWDRTYGESGSNPLTPQAMCMTNDNKCVIAGYHWVLATSGANQSAWQYQNVLINLDSQGNTVWEQSYQHELGTMRVYDIVSVGQDGFAVTGTGSGAQLLRVDSHGSPLWWKQYEEGTAGAYGICILPDGGFVLAGTSSKSGVDMPVVFRTDADGNLLWTKEDIVTAAPSSHYTVWDALVDAEGRIVLVGEAEKVEYIGNFFPRITDTGYIMQLDSTGNLNWYKSLGACWVNGVTLTDSGDYITAGTTGDHLQVIRVNTAGKVL